MFPEVIETDRLRLERLSRERVDARTLYEAASDRSPTIDEETAYLPWSPVDTLREAEERLAEFERSWDERERAEWAIRPREHETGAGEFAGTAGLICRWENDLALPAIWLRESFWGRRYSGERADGLLEVAFDRLDIGVAAVPIHGDNDRSRRAVDRYVDRHGGRYEGLLRNHAGRYDEPADHHRFSVSREEWREAGGARTTVRYPDADE
ncbi:GNAT family N-acetyltransferase [Halobaculum sp. CBA1158]|uniref:GNAT family N-acetyltransferase n=1 Tax=Halobaculum sp. CBA1158 TaxID=2904243 RepID=UPI001F33301D|nr:GNAT family protein [Halobaculum sp. CBA1158]UIP00610.1 GNAT family N-acetyltransferase [Halobaculum sp. CBA1158]